MDIDNLEELLVIEKRIDERDAEDIRDRWESGRVLIKERVKPKGRGRPGIPQDRMAALVEILGKGERELKYRIQFAEQYPTEENFCTAMQKITSWQQVKDILPKPPAAQPNTDAKPPAAPVTRNKQAAEIVELAEQGVPRKKIAEETGASERTVRRELELEALVDTALAEATPLDWATIPGNQRDKLERAKTSIRKQLEREFRTRLLAEVDQYRAKLDADLTAYKAAYDKQNAAFNAVRDEERRRYQEGIEVHRAKGLIAPDDYNLIRSCLHPDSRASATDEKLAAAFRLFNDSRIKTLLVKEKT